MDLHSRIDSIAWSEHEGAFGPAAALGDALRGCLAADPRIALAAADEVGSTIAHQGSLFPVSAVALPLVVELIARPELPARAPLAEWLVVVAESAAEVPRTGAVDRIVRAIAAKIVSGPLSSSDVDRSLERQVESGRAVRAVWPEIVQRIEPLSADPAVGGAITRALRAMRV